MLPTLNPLALGPESGRSVLWCESLTPLLDHAKMPPYWFTAPTSPPAAPATAALAEGARLSPQLRAIFKGQLSMMGAQEETHFCVVHCLPLFAGLVNIAVRFSMSRAATTPIPQCSTRTLLLTWNLHSARSPQQDSAYHWGLGMLLH